jgi:DNA helicase-4
MLSEQDHYENGEERRLFYVALTRASKKTFILTNKRKKSVFICEVENQTGASKNKCPRCIEGDIVIRENKANGNTFYGCSNYPWCDYKNQYKL